MMGKNFKWSPTLHMVAFTSGIIGVLMLVGAWIATLQGSFLGMNEEHLFNDAKSLFLMSIAGIIVVTDRYFYDRLFGLEYHGYSNDILSRIYKKLTPEPDLLILLDAKVKTALERESNGKHTLEFYEILREKYSQISNNESTWMISGDEFDQDEVLSRSLDKVISLKA